MYSEGLYNRKILSGAKVTIVKGGRSEKSRDYARNLFSTIFYLKINLQSEVARLDAGNRECIFDSRCPQFANCVELNLSFFFIPFLDLFFQMKCC